MEIGDGPKTVYVQFKDEAGNISTYSDMIILFLDTIAPVGNILVQNGDTYTQTASVVLNLSATDEGGSGLYQMSFSNNGTDFTDGEPYNTTKYWILESGDGEKTVYVKFSDYAGNTSIFSDTIILNTKKVIGTISINDGAYITSSRDVILTLTVEADENEISMNIGNSPGEGIWQPFQTSVPWTLTDGEGQKTVYVQYRDDEGALTTYSDNIYLDLTKPTGSISINEDADYTDNQTVSLRLKGQDTYGVKQMCFSDDGINFSDWEPYTSTRSYNISAGDGKKTVYVKFRDRADHESDVYQDSIILDRNPPTAKIYAYSNSTTVSLNIYAHDEGSGVSMVRFSNNGNTWSPWKIYMTRNIKEYNSQGSGVVFVQFRDNIGHTSGIYVAPIIFGEALQDNSIVFTSRQDGNSEIYVMNEDGSGQRNLTNHFAEDTSPCWAPDQYNIAFVSNRDGYKDIYLMDPDGSNQRKMIPTPAHRDMPVFSKDGRKIAFVSNRDGQNEIYVYDFQTQLESRVTYCNPGESASNPSWHPDGTELVYELTANGGTSIYTLVLADGSTSCLYRGGPGFSYADPVWSPDGINIAVVNKSSDGDVLLVTDRKRSFVNFVESGTSIQQPSWGPNSNDIVVTMNNMGTTEIYKISNVVSMGNRSTTQLTIQSLSSEPCWGGVVTWLLGLAHHKTQYISGGLRNEIIYVTNADHYSRIVLPVYDPSNISYYISNNPLMNSGPLSDTTIASMIIYGYREFGKNYKICATSLDDLTTRTDLYQLSSFGWLEAPVVSPDGRSVVFAYGDDEYIYTSGGIYLMSFNSNGSPITQRIITNPDYPQYSFPRYEYKTPSWSPDGLSICYLRETNYGSFNYSYDLWRMDLISRAETRLGNWSFDEMTSAVVGSSGNQIVFAAKNNGDNVNLYYIESPNFWDRRTVIEGDTKWIIPYRRSPDETKILFSHNDEYYIIHYEKILGAREKALINLFNK